jgi:hypothetical protein
MLVKRSRQPRTLGLKSRRSPSQEGVRRLRGHVVRAHDQDEFNSFDYVHDETMRTDALTLSMAEVTALGRSLGYSGNELDVSIATLERLKRGIDSKTLRGFVRRYRCEQMRRQAPPRRSWTPQASARRRRPRFRRRGSRSRARSSSRRSRSSDLPDVARLPGGAR